MKILLALTLLFSISAFAETATLGTPEQHSTLDAVDKDWNDFQAAYKDLTSFVNSGNVRLTPYQKIIDQFQSDIAKRPEKQALFLKIRKGLDEMGASMRTALLLDSVRASEKQFSKIYKMAKDVAAKLEMSQNFNIFILNSPATNAFTYSYDTNNFDVVLFKGLIEESSDDAIASVLAHEMGHVKDQAMVWGEYYLMEMVIPVLFPGRRLDNITEAQKKELGSALYPEMPEPYRAQVLNLTLSRMSDGESVNAQAVNMSSDFYMEVIFKMLAFGRYAESTADRYAVIYNRDKQNAALTTMSALLYSGKNYTDALNLEDLTKQMDEAMASQLAEQEDQKVIDLVNEQGSHPYILSRIMDMKSYFDSKGYQFLSGAMLGKNFGKEIYMLNQFSNDLSAIKKKSEDYDKEAENDDTLIRIRKQKRFKAQIAKLESAIEMLTQLVLLQVEGFGLDKDNTLFNELADTLKKEEYAVLKTTLAPKLATLLVTKIAAISEEEAKEQVAKLKKLDEATGKTTTFSYGLSPEARAWVQKAFDYVTNFFAGNAK